MEEVVLRLSSRLGADNLAPKLVSVFQVKKHEQMVYEMSQLKSYLLMDSVGLLQYGCSAWTYS